MARPPLYLLQRLRALRGDALVTYPYGSVSYKRVERTYSIPRAQGPDNFLIVDGEYSDVQLLEQHITGGDAQYVEIYQKYETLPGPHFVDTNTDETGIPMLVSKRHVPASTDYTEGEIIPGVLTITAITNAGGGKALVTVSAEHTLSPRMWVNIAGASVANGAYKILSVPAENQVTITATITAGSGGTFQGRNRITRELRSTDNLLVNILIDTAFGGQTISDYNEVDVPCFKDHSLPGYLKQATPYADNSESYSESAGVTSYEFSEATSHTGEVALDIQEGYKGPFKAKRSKLYFMGPPPDDFGDATIKPTIIITSSGTVLIGGGSLSWRESVSDAGTSSSFSRSVSFRAVRVNDVLTGDTPGVVDPDLAIINITSIGVASGGISTVQTATSHGFAVNQFVRFKNTNCTPALATLRVVAVTDSTHFTVRAAVTIAGTAAGTVQSAGRANFALQIPLSFPTKFSAGDIIRLMNEPEKLKAGGIWVLYYWKLEVPNTSGSNPP